MGETMTEKSTEEPSIFDRKDPHPERAVKPDPEQQKLKAELEKGLKDTFPASDPVSVSQPTTIGKKKRVRQTGA